MGAKDSYLILYNSLCCCGWAMTWALAVQSVATGIFTDGLSLGETLTNVYSTPNLEKLLIVSQTAALLEIIHSAIGLVRSPVVIATMQVMSRIVALVAVVYSADSQGQYSC